MMKALCTHPNVARCCCWSRWAAGVQALRAVQREITRSGRAGQALVIPGGSGRYRDTTPAGRAWRHTYDAPPRAWQTLVRAMCRSRFLRPGDPATTRRLGRYRRHNRPIRQSASHRPVIDHADWHVRGDLRADRASSTWRAARPRRAWPPDHRRGREGRQLLPRPRACSFGAATSPARLSTFGEKSIGAYAKSGTRPTHRPDEGPAPPPARPDMMDMRQ